LKADRTGANSPVLQDLTALESSGVDSEIFALHITPVLDKSDAIANTKPVTRLKIKARLTQRTYPSGIVIPAAGMARVNLTTDTFHGDWNDSSKP
jgi:hypothetical protein